MKHSWKPICQDRRKAHDTHDDAIVRLSIGNQSQDGAVLQKEKEKGQAARKVEDAALKMLAEQHKNPWKK